MSAHIAIDLGATSGRVVLGLISPQDLDLTEVHRFAHRPHSVDGFLVWDFETIWNEILIGLKLAEATAAKEGERIATVGVDTWAVDYGYIDNQGELVGPVNAYRSARTDGIMTQVQSRVGKEFIFEATGIQFLPFNTIYQLVSEQGQPDRHQAHKQLLLLPDLINNRLCGSTSVEVTNASTTQLLDPRTRDWHRGLLAKLDLPPVIFPLLHEPGSNLGTIRESLRILPGVQVIAVASHDTASAFAGTPLPQDESSLVLSCGTWALLGVESKTLAMGATVMDFNITNELGVEGTVRVLKNTTGLWLLEECRRAWEAEGIVVPVDAFSSGARRVPRGAIVDPDHEQFAKPTNMPQAIQEYCHSSGQQVPTTPVQICRVVLDSLVVRWKRVANELSQVTGQTFSQINMVGGGSQNQFLVELTAAALDLPVYVGPAEATVAGNLLVQAIGWSTIPNISSGRQLIRNTIPSTIVQPRPEL